MIKGDSMKTNNFTIINLLNVLNGYANKRLPQRISYAITRNIMTVEKEYNIYTEQLKKIISAYDQYLEKDNDGNVSIDTNGIPKINDDAQKKLFTEAAEAYKQALRNNPNDDETRYNLALCLKQIKNQPQQQQQKSQDENKNGDNNKNKEQEEKNENKDKKQQQDNQEQMSRENAEQLLNAAQQQEKATQQRLKQNQQQPRKNKHLKNW